MINYYMLLAKYLFTHLWRRDGLVVFALDIRSECR